MDDWKKELDAVVWQDQAQQRKLMEDEREGNTVAEQTKEKARQFVGKVVSPAFGQIQLALWAQNVNACMAPTDTPMSVAIAVPTHHGTFRWAVNVTPTVSEITVEVEGTDVGSHPIERDGRALGIGDITQQHIGEDFTHDYRKFLQL